MLQQNEFGLAAPSLTSSDASCAKLACAIDA